MIFISHSSGGLILGRVSTPCLRIPNHPHQPLFACIELCAKTHADPDRRRRSEDAAPLCNGSIIPDGLPNARGFHVDDILSIIRADQPEVSITQDKVQQLLHRLGDGDFFHRALNLSQCHRRQEGLYLLRDGQDANIDDELRRAAKGRRFSSGCAAQLGYPRLS